MKKRLIIGLLLSMAVVFTACGNSKPSDEEQKKVDDSSAFSIEMNENDENAPFDEEGKDKDDFYKDSKDKKKEDKDSTKESDPDKDKEKYSMKEKAALGAALADAGCEEDKVNIIELEFNKKKNRYDIAFSNEDTEYEYRVSPEGKILRKDFTRVGFVKEESTTNQVLEKTFKDAGAETLEEVGPYEYKIINEDGKRVYEINFKFDGSMHHYKVDAESGKLLDRSQDKIKNGEEKEEPNVIKVTPSKK